MNVLMTAPVFLLMMSVGMSLQISRIGENWKRFMFRGWIRLLLATFLIPPAFVLLMHRFMPLTRSEAVGLFMVAVAPGAPLVTRNIARRGFDMHLAASYQVWSAALTPLMIPWIVHLSGRLYDKDIWISPLLLIQQIVVKQFVPVVLGMLCARYAAVLSKKLAFGLNVIGNLLLVIVIVLVMVKLAPTLVGMNPWLPFASMLLALVCIGAIRLLLHFDVATERTLAICNGNRFVGLALLMTGESLHRPDAVPAIACYALVITFATILYPRFFPALQKASVTSATS